MEKQKEFSELYDKFHCDKCNETKNLKEWYERKCRECYDFYISNKLLDRNKINSLRNHYNRISLDYISGPISMYYYKLKCPFGDKNILLFGDEHTRLYNKCINQKCMYYDEYIIDIINKCQDIGKCVDLYVENALEATQTGLHKKSSFLNDTGKFMMGGSDIKMDEDTLNFVRRKFSNCLKTLDDCKINDSEISNLRSHNIDMRLYYDDGIDFEDGIDFADVIIYDHIYQASDDDEDLEFIAERINPIIQYVIGIGNNYLQILQILQSLQIEKKMVSVIISQYQYIRNKNIKEYKKYLKSKNQYFKPGAPDLREVYYNYIIKSNIYEKLNLVLIDFYQLLRMFMTFDDKKRGPTNCNTLVQDKIIVYAGDNHIKIYKDILDIYFKDNLVYSVDTESSSSTNKKKLKFYEHSVNKLGFRNFYQILLDFCYS